MSEISVLRLLKKNHPIIYDELIYALKAKYPGIYETLSQKPLLRVNNLDKIDLLVEIFSSVTKSTFDDIVKNKNNLRTLFITVCVKIYDPEFFIDKDKLLLYKLRESLARVLCCHETQISHTLATVRTYLRVYKRFREEVNYIYSKTVNILKDESENCLQGA